MHTIAIQMLKALLTEASNNYYQDGVSIMPDEEYDHLNNLLRYWEVADGAVIPSMDTTIITDHIDGCKKVKHATMMHSQRDIYTEEELNKWMQDMQDICKRELNTDASFVVEPKYDGLSCSLIYENDKLVRAVTRGDGMEGDDVTAQVMNLPSVPKEIECFGTCEVRGEIVMPYEAFDRVNKELVDKGCIPLANPRNAASGALKSLDPTIAAKRGLEFHAWELLDNASSQKDMRQSLTMLLLRYNFFVYSIEANSDDVMHTIDDIMRDRKDMPYAIDGCVVKLNYRSLWKSIGMAGKYPKYSVAYKFTQTSNYSKLLSVDWQVAKSGKITPVANYEPIQMNGTTCRRATMNSIKWVETNLNGICIGDTLELIKGGEIIPKILSYTPSDAEIREIVEAPTICPVCGKPTTRDGANVWCTNEECGARSKSEDVKVKSEESYTPTQTSVSDDMKRILNGAKVVVSGNFGTPQARKDIERVCTDNGATLQGGVTLGTTLIIVPDDIDEWKHKAGSKWQKIQEYCKQNVMMSKSEFMSALNP